MPRGRAPPEADVLEGDGGDGPVCLLAMLFIVTTNNNHHNVNNNEN